jgi:hypothetical protein
MCLTRHDIPWHMVGGFTIGGIIAIIAGCAGCYEDAQAPSEPAANTAVMEKVNTPEMVADLHRRERQFFDQQTKETVWPHPDPAHVVGVEWEPVFSPNGEQLHRTRVPGGWLVVYGDVAVIVTDTEHSWGR